MHKGRAGGYSLVIPSLKRIGYVHVPPMTTNNYCELAACVLAMQLGVAFNATATFTLISDSTYCVDGLSKWIHQWIMPQESTTPNFELWNAGHAIIKQHPNRFAFEWVRGHNGNGYNEIADRFAKYGVENIDGLSTYLDWKVFKFEGVKL